MLSGKSLYPEDTDEVILSECQLPPWMTLDCLYYFQVEREDGKFSLTKQTKKDGSDMSIPLRDCLQVQSKDMANSKEKGFSFKINVGDRIYHLQTDTEIERQQWLSCLQQSMATAKELHNRNNIQIKKNLDQVIQLYLSGQGLKHRQDLLAARLRQEIS